MLKITTVGGKSVWINVDKISHLEETKEKGARIWVPSANLYFDVHDKPETVAEVIRMIVRPD